MSIFDKLFGSPEVRHVRELIANTTEHVKTTYGPLRELATAIVQAADGSYRYLAPTLGFSLSGQPSQQQILIFYELLYFFTHLTMRAASREGFSEVQFSKCQSYLVPVLVSTGVDSFFAHWPEQSKSKIRTEFLERLNTAEIEYSECRGLVSNKTPYDTTTLLGRLGSNIAELADRPSDDRQAVTATIASVHNALDRMDLVTRVKAVRVVIDASEELPWFDV